MHLDDLLKTHRTIIFDLDDTIFCESDYLFGVFRVIAKEVMPEKNIQGFEFLRQTFETSGRKELLQKFIHEFQLKCSIQELLIIYREIEPEAGINCLPWFVYFAENKLAHIDKLRILTNGNPNQQRNKVRHLKIPGKWDCVEVVCAKEFQSKPDTLAYEGLVGYQNFHDPLYVGDSKTDRIFCQNLGIDFVQVCDLEKNWKDRKTY